MAEKIVSPGVFTQEKDLSFLPQGIGEIGAAFVGPTVKGPAFVPTTVESGNEFELMFGPVNNKMYTPFAIKNYLKNAGRATVIRTLGIGGYKVQYPATLVLSGSYGLKTVGVLHPSVVITNDDDTDYFEASTITDNGSGNFVLTLSGSMSAPDSTYIAGGLNKNGTPISASIDPESNSFIGDLFPRLAETNEPVYNYALFETAISESLAADANSEVQLQLGTGATEWDFQNDYSAGSTPWITSQQLSGASFNLFKVHHLSHGTDTNYEIKAIVSNIRPAGSIPGSSYGTFTLTIRAVDQDNLYGTPYNYDDSDSRPNILEQFDNLNLDPASTNYIARRIGDRYTTVDANGKVTFNADWPNKSKYIRIEMDEAVKEGALSATLVPFGFEPLKSPIPTGFALAPAVKYVQDQNIGGVYNKKKVWGFDFGENDNLNFLKQLPVADNQNTGSNSAFYLGDFSQPAGANYPSVSNIYTGSIDLTTNTAVATRRFAVPFQGGFDGWRPHLQKRMGAKITATNSQGFDLTSGNWGDTAYRRALAAVSNPDEYDINMLVTPGVINELHPALVARGIEVCEDRSDCFYVMDGFGLNDSVQSVTTGNATTLDSNYTATWYPWVKILDVATNLPLWVPPSVVLPGVIAYSDRVSQPWYAPAGLNRGGVTEAIEAKTRLTHAERDDLYENRINPIASFPNEGVVVWGQKTLQAKPSALDRINVRRLLIALKKFIASSSRYLVFENNTAVTRNQFLNIVNPYLESVQQRQGLYAFKVVMDETNNTPDIIDRNILYGQIFLQPAKTVEFVVLDFNILPTGATFPE